jgi:hypothetical protein
MPFFRGSKTPAGLYARQKWLGQAGETGFQQDFSATVKSILRGQSADGSWQGSLIKTIRALFGLHLTLRKPDQGISQGLSWLLDKALPWSRARLTRPAPAELWGLPFVPGRGDVLLGTAALFLACIFDRAHEPVVRTGYKEALDLAAKGPGKLGWASVNNLLRALAVHPRFSRHEHTQALVDRLGQAQGRDGLWPRGVSLHQTFNALAHLKEALPAKQLEPVLIYLQRSQGADRGWGRTDRAWKTFLVVHALKRLGLLKSA